MDHPDLDFGLSSHDGLPVIRDFAVAPNGNLLLLQLSRSICEFTPAGVLVGTYEFPFDARGLTAYMLTCGPGGDFYMLDGHNQVFIKADRTGILNVCALGDDAPIADTGLMISMYAPEEDILQLTASTVDGSFVYRVDVSGGTAVFLGEPVEGQALGGDTYYRVALQRNGDGSLKNSVRLTIDDRGLEHSGVIAAEYQDAQYRTSALVGLALYGPADESGYLGKVFEWRIGAASSGAAPGDEVPVETFVLVDDSCTVRKVFPADTEVGATIRNYGGTAYSMAFTDEGLLVAPLTKLLAEGSAEHWFVSQTSLPSSP